MRKIMELRDNYSLTKIIVFILTVFTLSTVVLQFVTYATKENTFVNFVILMFYYTTQSNILVFIVMLLFLFNHAEKPYFKYLSFIALFNITITAIIFHLLLANNMPKIGYLQHSLHTIVPLIYFLFYFIFVPKIFRIRHAWIGLIYPLIYAVNIYLWKEPLFGNYIDLLYDQLPGMRFIYPFFDPSQYPGGVKELLLFIIGLLTPGVSVVSYSLLSLKAGFELYIAKIKSDSKM